MRVQASCTVATTAAAGKTDDHWAEFRLLQTAPQYLSLDPYGRPLKRRIRVSGEPGLVCGAAVRVAAGFDFDIVTSAVVAVVVVLMFYGE